MYVYVICNIFITYNLKSSGQALLLFLVVHTFYLCKIKLCQFSPLDLFQFSVFYKMNILVIGIKFSSIIIWP